MLILGLPMIAGMATVRYLPKLADRPRRPLQILSFLFLVVFIAGATLSNARYLTVFLQSALPFVVLHNLIAIGIGWGIARVLRLSDYDTRALTVEVTQAGEPRSYTCGDGCDPAAVAKAIEGTENTMRACTELYGGPETAHVTGTLEGEAVDVTITRNDGCGIADYEALFEALGVKPPLAR